MESWNFISLVADFARNFSNEKRALTYLDNALKSSVFGKKYLRVYFGGFIRHVQHTEVPCFS